MGWMGGPPELLGNPSIQFHQHLFINLGALIGQRLRLLCPSRFFFLSSGYGQYIQS
jgi:hypothetical protein